MIRIASAIGEAGVALRLQLRCLTPKAINFELFWVHRSVSPSDGRRIDTQALHPLARQVLRDLQVLDAHATLAKNRNRRYG